MRDLRQEGCLKARFPYGADWMDVALLNTSGGVAGGDRLKTDIALQQNGRATFATQAAERIYRALPDDPPAHIRTRISVAAGASAEWLPQETILFDRCAIDRVLDIDVAAGGWFLGVESLVFGRTAMGETVERARLRDTIRVTREGRLLLYDATRLEGKVAAVLDRPAVANGGRAVATLVCAAPDAAERLESLRNAWAEAPAETGASVRDGLLLGRVVARDGAALRATVIAGLQSLRDGRTLPRVWMS